MTEDASTPVTTTLIEVEFDRVPSLNHDAGLALSISDAVRDVVRTRYGMDNEPTIEVRRFDVEYRGKSTYFTKVDD